MKLNPKKDKLFVVSERHIIIVNSLTMLKIGQFLVDSPSWDFQVSECDTYFYVMAGNYLKVFTRDEEDENNYYLTYDNEGH